MTNDTKPDPRELKLRLRQLLSIPERERTDAEWDEIVEIEIRLGPTSSALSRSPDQPPGGPKPEKRNMPKTRQTAKSSFPKRKNRSA